MMKVFFRCIFISAVICIMQYVQAQDVVEVKPFQFTDIYLKIMEEVHASGEDDTERAIQPLETVLEKKIDSYEAFGIMAWGLPNLYAKQKEYSKFLTLGQIGLERGYFFPFGTGVRPYPEFILDIDDQKQIENLLKKNAQIKENYGIR